MDRVINEVVLARITERKLVWKNIVRRRNEWIGHIMRQEELLKSKTDYRRNHRGEEP
jgi:hypothetical protein